MLSLAEVGLSEADAASIAEHANKRELNRLHDLANAFKVTRQYINAGWVAVGQSPYPRSGLFLEKNGERKLVPYD